MGDHERQAATPATGTNPRAAWGGKALAASGGLVIGLLSGVFTTALSPIGESLRERLSPTVASVSGNVVKSGASIRAQVQLDGDPDSIAAPTVDTTDDWGGFGFHNVSTGSHSLYISEDGATVSYHREFTVGVGERAKELGDMDLAVAQPRLRPVPAEPVPAPAAPGDRSDAAPAPTVNAIPTVHMTFLPEETEIASGDAPPPTPEPTFDLIAGLLETPAPTGTWWTSLDDPLFPTAPAPIATPAADAGAESDIEIVVDSQEIPSNERQSWMPTNAHRVAIWVDAPPDVLSRIDRVTYSLPETFNPSIVTRYSALDEFRLSLDTGDTWITATIYFDGGASVDHFIPLAF